LLLILAVIIAGTIILTPLSLCARKFGHLTAYGHNVGLWRGHFFVPRHHSWGGIGLKKPVQTRHAASRTV
jgi:hypothetical protein